MPATAGPWTPASALRKANSRWSSFWAERHSLRSSTRRDRSRCPLRRESMCSRSRHWYSADLHHHADQAEAVTPPADLARSQLAAGLDLLFVSDHDSMANHRALQAIAARRGVPFIPSVELSASWGHFNAYPLTLGAPLSIDTGTATV